MIGCSLTFFSPASPSRTWWNELSSKFSMHLLFNCGEWLFCNQAIYAGLPWRQISNSRLYSALGLILELPLMAVRAMLVYLGKYTALCVTVRLLWHRAWKPKCRCESLRKHRSRQCHTSNSVNGSKEYRWKGRAWHLD